MNPAPGQDVVTLLQSLVRIPSINPLAHPAPGQGGEKRCAEAVASYLSALGALDVSTPEVLPDRPNVLARMPSDRPGKPRLLLAPHLDTVGVSGMTVDPFAAEVRDGKIWGRGTTDTKGTMSAMLRALYELREVIPGLDHEIWFAGLMGEEAGNEGAAWIVSSGFRADFALIGEPTSCDVLYAHKGATWLRLTTRGKAAHAAEVSQGVNAIYKMADVARRVRDDLCPLLASRPDPLLGPATASLGVIAGGRKINVVPDCCEAELDVRTLPNQQDDDFLAELTGVLRGPEGDVEVDLMRRHPPMFTDLNHPMIERFTRVGAKTVTASWFCDGSLLSQGGIPSVAAGPGSIAQAHTVDEFLEIAELERGVEFYKAFLCQC
jgi:acetylornithine deacetylase/succinyl-diaminopimelate desuccinylase-like protein